MKPSGAIVPLSRCKGVTLVELVLVIVLLGILAVVGASRFFGTQTYDERGFAAKTISALRYAQKTAISSRCDIQVNLDGGADAFSLSYTGQRNGVAAGGCPSTAVTRPGGGSYSASAPAGVDVQSSVTVTYRPLGDATGIAGTTNVSVGAFTLTLDPVTGLAYVQGW